MLTHAQFAATRTAQTVADHLKTAGWEDGDARYSLGMMLGDLLVFAHCYGIDFDDEMRQAREVFDEVYDKSDVQPIPGAVFPQANSQPTGDVIAATPDADVLRTAAVHAETVRRLVGGDLRLSEDTRAMVNHTAGRLAAAADAG